MGLMDRFRAMAVGDSPRDRHVEAKQRAVTPSGGRQIDDDLRATSALKRRLANDRRPKRGMWVWYKQAERIGILTNMEPGDICTVMLVDPKDGTNVLEIHLNGAELRQAYYDEIPEARRPSLKDCESLGYGRQA